jgi:hypothetical protein
MIELVAVTGEARPRLRFLGRFDAALTRQRIEALLLEAATCGAAAIALGHGRAYSTTGSGRPASALELVDARDHL